MFLQCMMLCIIYSAHAQNSRQIKCKYSIGPFAWSYSYCGIKKACCFIDSNWKCIDTIGDAWSISYRCKFHERSKSHNKTTTTRHLMNTTTLPAYMKTTYNRRQRNRNMNRMNIGQNSDKTLRTNILSRRFPRYIRSTTEYRYSEYEPTSEVNLFRILPAVIVVAMVIFVCVCCCLNNDRKQRRMRLKNRRRLQQSRALQQTNEQQQFSVIGLYYDNGNAVAGVTYPRTQLSYGADLERLINSTSGCSASLPTVNPPAYEAIINNGNKTAIDSYNPRTYTGDVEKRHTQHIPNNGTVFTFIDDTKYIPTVSPPAYEDIMKENAAAIVSYNPGTHTQDNEERLANYIANDGTVTHL
ncbi:uncharacterized protein LOC143043192 [Mytilus galloprovincialis]|uniref:uncharacterized protein LOC143043192 n=1 Tax=Mytilus galloprovincialis TaxID=29158 RepID=UPI003F7BB007